MRIASLILGAICILISIVMSYMWASTALALRDGLGPGAIESTGNEAIELFNSGFKPVIPIVFAIFIAGIILLYFGLRFRRNSKTSLLETLVVAFVLGCISAITAMAFYVDYGNAIYANSHINVINYAFYHGLIFFVSIACILFLVLGLLPVVILFSAKLLINKDKYEKP